MFRSPIAKEIREQILGRIKADGLPVAQIAREHGVNPKTVYGWLENEAGSSPGVLGLNRLRRENQALLLLVGRLTAEMEKQKRGRS